MVDQERTFGEPVDYQPEPAEQYQEPARERTSPGTGGLLGLLQQEATEALDDQIKLRVALRPGWVLEFSSTISQQQIRGWEQRSSRGKGKARTVDAVRQSALMLVEQSTGVYHQGEDGTLEQVLDEDGDALTLTSLAWLDVYPDLRRDSVQVLRKFAGDSGVLALGAALINASGWGDAADQVEDPTEN